MNQRGPGRRQPPLWLLAVPVLLSAVLLALEISPVLHPTRPTPEAVVGEYLEALKAGDAHRALELCGRETSSSPLMTDDFLRRQREAGYGIDDWALDSVEGLVTARLSIGDVTEEVPLNTEPTLEGRRVKCESRVTFLDQPALEVFGATVMGRELGTFPGLIRYSSTTPDLVFQPDASEVVQMDDEFPPRLVASEALKARAERLGQVRARDCLLGDGERSSCAFQGLAPFDLTMQDCKFEPRGGMGDSVTGAWTTTMEVTCRAVAADGSETEWSRRLDATLAPDSQDVEVDVED